MTAVGRPRNRWCCAATTLVVAACAGSSTPAVVLAPVDSAVVDQPAAADRTQVVQREPVLPPQLAMLAGLLPLRTLGADSFRLAHPTYDGRGVLIGILDSGMDPAVPGLQTTTTGQRKILDLRDFSGEGRIALVPVRPNRDGTVDVGGHRLTGFSRVIRLASGPYYGGVFRELLLGAEPAADVNGNGRITDEFPVIVAKASDGWIAMTDTDSDGSLDDERPVHDYGVAPESFTYRSHPDSPGPVTIAVNFSEEDGRPVLDFVVDNSSHGTHVAGIAAGHNMFGVEGFDGVAPGAQLLGLKISNNARGGISVTGSMLRAMNYAADYANRRALPLILNLSFGVGNEIEGAASIDSMIDQFALEHPDVLFVISAGNDGPGLSTLGFPGSADFALTVCALFPGVFARPPQPGVPAPDDVLGWWSARGGESAKPDVCGPGVAFSNVPAWRAGEEISGGTSMAAPHVAGAAALLASGIRQNGGRARAIDLKRALMATATPLAGTTTLDEGAGVPNVSAAFRWLRAAHQTGVYAVRAAVDGGNSSSSSAAYRRNGLASPGDTVQHFVVTSVAGQPAARLLLESDAPWLHAPELIEPGGGPVTVRLTYDADAIREPGVYVGTVWARPATDTLAGPSFGLTNTVIVPHTLAQPLRRKGMLTPGAAARHFLAVPEGSGGLTLQLEVPGRTQQATLHLFEPSGQPYRGGSSRLAGGDSMSVTLVVSAEDVIPGVYEAVVVGSPIEPANYELAAQLPAVTVTSIGTGPSATLRNHANRRVSATVSAGLLGTVQTQHVEGEGARPVVVRTAVPRWATKMVVDVALPTDAWNALTDFGVTIFDALGRKLSDGPLDYAFGRQTIELDSAHTAAELEVELFPAFAHTNPPVAWSADLRVAYLVDEPITLELLGEGTAADIGLPPNGTISLQFAPPPADFDVPANHVPFVEVSAATDAAPAAVRRGPVGR